jgi:hypothetical protein
MLYVVAYVQIWIKNDSFINCLVYRFLVVVGSKDVVIFDGRICLCGCLKW